MEGLNENKYDIVDNEDRNILINRMNSSNDLIARDKNDEFKYDFGNEMTPITSKNNIQSNNQSKKIRIKSKLFVQLKNEHVTKKNSLLYLKTHLMGNSFFDIYYTLNCFSINNTYFQNDISLSIKKLVKNHKLTISRNMIEIQRNLKHGNLTLTNSSINPYKNKYNSLINLNSNHNLRVFSNINFKYSSNVDSEKNFKKEYNTGMLKNDKFIMNLNLYEKSYYFSGNVSYIKAKIYSEETKFYNPKALMLNSNIESSLLSFKLSKNIKEIKYEDACINNKFYFSVFLKPLSINNWITCDNNLSLSNCIGFKLGIRLEDLFLYFKLSKSFHLTNNIGVFDSFSSLMKINFFERNILTFGIKNKYIDFKIPICNHIGEIHNLFVFPNTIYKEEYNVISDDYSNIDHTKNISEMINFTNLLVLTTKSLINFIGLSLLKHFTFKTINFVNKYFEDKNMSKKNEERLEQLKNMNSTYMQFNQKLLGNAMKIYEREINDKNNGLIIVFGLIGSFEKLVTIYNDSFFVEYTEKEVSYIRKKPEKENFINLLEITIFLLNNITIKKGSETEKNYNSDNMIHKEKKEHIPNCSKFIFSEKELFEKYIEIDFSVINDQYNDNNNLGIYNPLLNKDEMLWILVVFIHKGKRYVKFCKANKKITIP